MKELFVPLVGIGLIVLAVFTQRVFGWGAAVAVFVIGAGLVGVAIKLLRR